jgi:hypothetical protein
MTSAVATRDDFDVTHLTWVLRNGIKLGLIEAVFVFLYSLADRFLPQPIELIVCAIILLAGVAAVVTLPGLWTKPRTIEGIAGAAGIGLVAAVTFMLVDVAILQPLGIYTNRWLQIGGGANWWYHPVWWQVGSFLPWMGAWIMANQTARNGRPSPVTMLGMVFVIAAVVMAIAAAAGFPGAGWGLGTFGVSILPALALTTVISAMGARKA